MRREISSAIVSLPYLDVFLKDMRARLTGEDIAEFIDRNEFGATPGLRVWIAARIEETS